MKPTRHVIAFLLAGIAAVGCSKRNDPSPVSGESDAAQLKPVKTSGESLSIKPRGGDGLDAGGTAIPAVPATFADGKAAYDARKYSEATASFESYTARRPENAWGYYMLGLSAWKSGDLAKAEGSLEKALSIDPRHVKSLVNLSRIFISQKRNDEALAALTRAADIDPDSTDVHRLLGRTYEAVGRTKEAIEAYSRAIELNELDAWSMNNLGLLYLEQKRIDEALPLFAKAVELKKEVPAFHNNLGMALEHTGRFGDAAAAYSGALAADPGYEKAKKNLERVEAIEKHRQEKTTCH
jgi:tetratricopeptide (TPR) repeat protein